MKYTVKKGDSLSAIAKRFHITLADLLAENPQISNPNQISMGQQIDIPHGAGGGSSALPPPHGSVELIFGAVVSLTFRRKVVALATRLGVDPNYLMAVMAFESGESFSPSIKNKHSGATGLIQFMPSTAASLGTSLSALAAMTAEEQLNFVEAYLSSYRGKLQTLEDTYMAVLWPKAIGKPNDYVLFRQGTKAYTQNAGLDADLNGLITKAEAAAKVRKKLQAGVTKSAPVSPEESISPTTATRGRRSRGVKPAPRPTRALRADGDPIEHIVVLMLENRSFDHSLGALQPHFAAKGIAMDGIDPSQPPRRNFVQAGPPFEQRVLTPPHMQASLSMPDPMHEASNVKLQLGGPNAYFVLDYALTYPKSARLQRELIMNYHAAGALPALHTLATSFTVCDRWYSSVPGPTWTNRFFAHSGTSLGRVEMPKGVFEPNLHLYNQDTIYDRLNEKDIPWRIYYGDIPHSLLLTHQLKPSNAWRYSRFSNFTKDAAGPAAEFPAFVFIEPSYMGEDANDDHPPHDVMRGQRLIASVYNTLRKNEELFRSTLLVVTYDEHGGFYDHVAPPAAVPPDQYTYEYDFKRFGVRVPAVLVSPWVDANVSSTPFDHTSILRYAIDKWGLGPLGNRTAAAQSIGSAIRRTGNPRRDIPSALSVSRTRAATVRGGRGPRRLNENQEGLLLFSEYLEATRTRGRAMRPMRGTAPLSRASMGEAVARVDRFLQELAARR